MLGVNPQLLELATSAPSATHGAPDDGAGRQSGEAGQRPDFMNRGGRFVGCIQAVADHACVLARDIVVHGDGQLLWIEQSHVFLQKLTGSSERHMYHVPAELHGAHFLPISRISSLVRGSPSL